MTVDKNGINAEFKAGDYNDSAGEYQSAAARDDKPTAYARLSGLI